MEEYVEGGRIQNGGEERDWRVFSGRIVGERERTIYEGQHAVKG